MQQCDAYFSLCFEVWKTSFYNDFFSGHILADAKSTSIVKTINNLHTPHPACEESRGSMNRRVRSMARIYPLFPKDAQTKVFSSTVRLWIWLCGQIVSWENMAMKSLWQRKGRIEKSELVGLWWYLQPVLPWLNAPLYRSFLPPWLSILFPLLQPPPSSNPLARELWEG